MSLPIWNNPEFKSTGVEKHRLMDKKTKKLSLNQTEFELKRNKKENSRVEKKALIVCAHESILLICISKCNWTRILRIHKLSSAFIILCEVNL